MAPATFNVGHWVRTEYERRYNCVEMRRSINWRKFGSNLIKLRPQDEKSILTEVEALQGTVRSVREETLEEWVYRLYLEQGFTNVGFKGFSKFIDLLEDMNPFEEDDIFDVVQKLRQPGHKYSFGEPNALSGPAGAELRNQKLQTLPRSKNRAGMQGKGGVSVQSAPTKAAPVAQDQPPSLASLFPGSFPVSTSNAATPTSASDTASGSMSNTPASPFAFGSTGAPNNTNTTGPYVFKSGTTAVRFDSGNTGTLGDSTAKAQSANGTGRTLNMNSAMPKANTAAKVNTAAGQTNGFGLKSANGQTTGQNILTNGTESSQNGRVEAGDCELTVSDGLDGDEYSEELVEASKRLTDFIFEHHDTEAPPDLKLGEVQHAPVISEEMVRQNQADLPQYGYLGIHANTRARMFQNTNVPFASFVCGVQGSGKSHTTACMLENALIPVSDARFGRLEKPLSAMVFAYDDFNGNGEGFSVSEAASLASAHAQLPKNYRVKKVTVLVSPSNPAIKRIYSNLPNVTVIPFKLHPRSLNVKTILTLMAVDESSEPPLYLAQVVKILREINVETNGRFDYLLFKQRLALCNFNPSQTNMLQLRLDLLESFLDIDGNAPQPQFRPGEVTIMDMSCPFVDKNTACILFKIGLHRYLESDVAGKMVVLDEAHKYMAKVPGAKELNNELITTIRLQRHKGVRTIIATQEPTLLTDLIALCDVTVIHRFSSPEWFAALQKHIPMASQDRKLLLEDIEALKPGTALVYSPKGIFGTDDEGALVKGTGKLMRVSVRKRITADGGQSILAA